MSGSVGHWMSLLVRIDTTTAKKKRSPSAALAILGRNILIHFLQHLRRLVEEILHSISLIEGKNLWIY